MAGFGITFIKDTNDQNRWILIMGGFKEGGVANGKLFLFDWIKKEWRALGANLLCPMYGIYFMVVLKKKGMDLVVWGYIRKIEKENKFRHVVPFVLKKMVLNLQRDPCLHIFKCRSKYTWSIAVNDLLLQLGVPTGTLK